MTLKNRIYKFGKGELAIGALLFGDTAIVEVSKLKTPHPIGKPVNDSPILADTKLFLTFNSINSLTQHINLLSRLRSEMIDDALADTPKPSTKKKRKK